MTEAGEAIRLLQESTQKFTSVFRPDLTLVAQSAKEHHIKMTSGSILARPFRGEYNLRLPQKSSQEITALLHTQTIVVACMDYRQSAEVVDMTYANAWILMAGGATQPDENRLGSLVDLIVTTHTVNPNANFILLGHNRRCGGVNYYTGGKIQNISPTEEMQELWIHLDSLARRLIQRSVPRTAFSLGVVNINEGNRFSGIQYRR